MSTEEKILLTEETAIAMLPDGDSIHTFRSAGMAIIGCDWDRQDLIKAIKYSSCEVGGPMCRDMGHGLVVHNGNPPLFVQVREDFDYSTLESAK